MLKKQFNKTIKIFLTLYFCYCSSVYSQKMCKQFNNLSFPEKKWTILHVFKAKRIYKLSQEAIIKTNELKNDTTLDGDINGGQLDAFRHAYWMAIITQKFGSKVSASLGKAHEKGNYLYFVKHKTEEGTIPDEQFCQMDSLNNLKGIEIGQNNSNISKDETEKIIILKIKNGELFILKKNKDGIFLDCNNAPIILQKPDNQWHTNKCITSSNKK